jgi:hypothetical protein
LALGHEGDAEDNGIRICPRLPDIAFDRFDPSRGVFVLKRAAAAKTEFDHLIPLPRRDPGLCDVAKWKNGAMPEPSIHPDLDHHPGWVLTRAEPRPNPRAFGGDILSGKAGVRQERGRTEVAELHVDAVQVI